MLPSNHAFPNFKQHSEEDLKVIEAAWRGSPPCAVPHIRRSSIRPIRDPCPLGRRIQPVHMSAPRAAKDWSVRARNCVLEAIPELARIAFNVIAQRQIGPSRALARKATRGLTVPGRGRPSTAFHP